MKHLPKKKRKLINKRKQAEEMMTKTLSKFDMPIIPEKIVSIVSLIEYRQEPDPLGNSKKRGVMTTRNSDAGLIRIGSPTNSESRYQFTQTDKGDSGFNQDERLKSGYLTLTFQCLSRAIQDFQETKIMVESWVRLILIDLCISRPSTQQNVRQTFLKKFA